MTRALRAALAAAVLAAVTGCATAPAAPRLTVDTCVTDMECEAVRAGW